MADLDRLFPQVPQRLYLSGLRREIAWRLSEKDREHLKLKDDLKRAVSQVSVLTKIRKRYTEEFRDYDALHDFMRGGMTVEGLQRTEEFFVARDLRWT